jgi:hypothetical protein
MAHDHRTLLPVDGTVAVCKLGKLEEEKNHEEEAQAIPSREVIAPAAQRVEEPARHPVATLDRGVRADRSPAGETTHQRGRYNLDLSVLINEPDSFKRQKEALFQLARYLKRVPTEEEALAFLQEKRLFSGNWEENLTRRM